ncbi:FidL-like protein [Pantoea sp. NSTU24]|uniref:FidL-like protein n=1 Tax=Pantoea sp. NSTU24 TaxID=3391144 RepID=UPI003D006958
MKRNVSLIIIVILSTLAAIVASLHYKKQDNDYSFRCSAFSRYDLSRREGKSLYFYVSQDLRFINQSTGYLLINGQATSGGDVTVVNRRIALLQGRKIDSKTYGYKISNVITSSDDTTPDDIFNKLLAEITLDPQSLQIGVSQIDNNMYLIRGPLSYLFTCKRY